jgi:hypothetical protein
MSLVALGFLVSVLSCTQNQIGNISGQIIKDGTSASIDVNFTSISFPSTAATGTLVILLTNNSSHSIQFTLTAVNATGATLTSQFPTGAYNIDGSTNQFVGTLPFQGTSTTDVTGLSGTFNLTSFQIGQDSGGNTAVALIGATYTINIEGGGILSGSLEKDFTK